MPRETAAPSWLSASTDTTYGVWAASTAPAARGLTTTRATPGTCTSTPSAVTPRFAARVCGTGVCAAAGFESRFSPLPACALRSCTAASRRVRSSLRRPTA